MTSATDVITYIGVPLAVFGVLPLLWNMVKSFMIRYRLLRTLPKELRRHYSLIMDPASGTVSVGADAMCLDFRGLLQTLAPDPSKPEWRPYPRARDRRYLFRNWMELVSFGADVMIEHLKDTQQFLVASDMRVDAVGLHVNWATFIIIALALGVDPCTGGLQNLKLNGSTQFHSISLTFRNGIEVIKMTRREDTLVAHFSRSLYKLDVREALAWAAVMVVPQGKVIHIIPMKNSIALDMAALGRPVLGFEIWPAQDTTLKDYPDVEIRLTLMWALYTDSVFHGCQNAENSHKRLLGEWEMPVRQDILMVKIQVTEELKKMEHHLEHLFQEILSSPTPKGQLGSKILQALKSVWRHPETHLVSAYCDNDLDRESFDDIQHTHEAIQATSTFKTLVDNFNPVPSLRTRNDIDLNDLQSHEAVLARVVIIFSSIRNWHHCGRSLNHDCDGSSIPGEPLEDLLSSSQGPFSSVWNSNMNYPFRLE